MKAFAPGDVVEIEVNAVVAGGDGISRGRDGKVIFVAHALAGERVRAIVTEARRDYCRAIVDEVIVPSPDRIVPRCPEVARGCGGCDLTYLDRGAQPNVKAGIVIDGLRRLGQITDPVVRPGLTLKRDGFRTTVRAAVVDGRAGFRMARSHDVVHVGRCGVIHPSLEELLVEGFFAEASEVTLRIGVHTGERLALVDPACEGVKLPDDVIVVGMDELNSPGGVGRRAWHHEIVQRRRFRISAGSFFQTNAHGVEHLVDLVRRMSGDLLDVPGTALDAYCGVGLFASCFASSADVPLAKARQFIAVERNGSAVDDARHNLSDRHAVVVSQAVEDCSPKVLGAGSVDLVIADPARAGLGRRGVDALVSSGTSRVVLVSCDPGSLGRDARMLSEAGYAFVEAELVDMFPDTHHVEVVSRFDRR